MTDRVEASPKMEPVDWQVNKASLECAQYMLENQVNCDVNFKVGDKEEVVKGHKFILSMRSPVFERMFNGSFCESETDPLIPDVSPAAFRTLLRYCYYECLDIKGESALSVLYAATKYMLPILEKAARKTLIAKFDRTTIWHACKYSTEVSDKELQLGCSAYFKRNLSAPTILDVTRYAVSVEDKELHSCCNDYLKKILSGSNIWEVYKYAVSNGDKEVHRYCREFFEKDVAKVRNALRSEGFCNLSYEMLFDILHINDKTNNIINVLSTKFENNPGISVSEIELFRACDRWAEAECRRQKIDLTGANRRRVLRECLVLIRFPTMLEKDLLTTVLTTGVLTQPEVVKICQYMQKVPGSECQLNVHFKEREFVVTPSGDASAGHNSTMYVESAERVMLSKVWTLASGQYRITVKGEGSQGRLWSKVLVTKHDSHMDADTRSILHYLPLEPQLFEAGSRYSVTAERTRNGKEIQEQLGIKYIYMERIYNLYKEVKITRKPYTDRFSSQPSYRDNMYGLTFYLV